MNRRELVAGIATVTALGALGVKAQAATRPVPVRILTDAEHRSVRQGMYPPQPQYLYAEALRDEPIQNLKLQKDVVLRDGQPVEHHYMEITYMSGRVERVETNFLILMATTRLAKQDEGHPASQEFIRDVSAAIEKRVA